MTGNTGSLRYMAPEVALKRPYSEKVDVYSFGILVWQMARDKIPFKGLNKEEFMRNIVAGGQRPKLDKSWPVGFSSLLQKCWNTDASQRPSFSRLVSDFNKLIDEEESRTPWIRLNSRPSTTTTTSTTSSTPRKALNSESTWF